MRARELIERKSASLSRVMEALAPTYGGRDGRNPIGEDCEQPSETEVLRVLQLLDDVFYPGYRPTWPRGAGVEEVVLERLDEAFDILYRQVRLALPLRWLGQYARTLGAAGPAPMDDDQASQEARRVVESLFEALPAIRELLKLDVIAAYNGDPAARSYTEIILSYPGLRAITTHRIAHELYRLDVPLIPRLMSEDVHRRSGIEIHPGARIGESFFIDHGTGVVIGETTVIGNRVKIYHGVTLGARSFALDEQGNPVKAVKRHPTIEDDVVIYPGATILGGETVVGAGSVVNGNVFLTRSVPPGTVVTQRLAWEQQNERRRA